MCGKRLNAWKTIPIPRRTRLTSTPARVISSPREHDPARVDGLEEVDAAEERRLTRAGRADQAHDLVLGEREVDPAQHLELAERLAHALELERGAAAVHRAAPASCRRLSRSTSQSVKRASGIVRRMKSSAVAR